jgi:hypothetical protein
MKPPNALVLETIPGFQMAIDRITNQSVPEA